MSNRRRAFTLIELLVVVAIVIALLAMLLPSMQKAIYISQLASCSSNIRQNTISALNYCSDFYGAYPYRQTFGKPNDIKRGGDDDRPVLVNHFDMEKVIHCPLSDPVDFINTEPRWMETAYNLFFGFAYAGQQRMSRIGTQWTFGGQSYSLIISDRDVIHHGGNYVHGSHPDRDGFMAKEALEQNNGLTLSRWIRYGGNQRGLIDMNFGYEDGSVIRLYDLERADDRLDAVPEFATWGSYPVAPAYVAANQ